MESYDSSMSTAFALMGMSSILLFYLLIFLFVIVIIVISMIIVGYPYYRMAKKVGLPHAWLAFIPIANVYIMLNLPQREFNIFDWIKTNDRSKVFWIYLISIPAVSAAGILIGILSGIPIIGLIFVLLSYLLSFAYYVACGILNWRISYDILMTYGMAEHALWASIVGVFVPIVMVVFSFIIMNNEPDYTV